MATFSGTTNIHENYAYDMGKGDIDYDLIPTTRQLRVGLSDTEPLPASHSRQSQLPGPPAVGNGYQEVDAPAVTWIQTGGKVVLDSGDIVFTAAGGQITAKYYWVVFYQTGNEAGNPVIQSGLLNSADVPVTVEDTDEITIRPHPSDGWNDITIA